MLDRAIKMKNVLNHLKDEVKEFFKYRESINNECWQKCEKLHDFLKIFNDSTNIISGSNYPKISIVLPIFENIMSYLNDIKDDYLETIVSTIKDKFNIYENLIKNDLTILATILDLRFKLEFFDAYINIADIKLKIKNFTGRLHIILFL